MNRNRVERRFLAKVKKTNTCWIWIGASPVPGGYGCMRVDGKTMKAHRLAFELYNGPILPGLQVCHTCDVMPCVNPTHLFLGTRSDNMRDMVAKGRHRNGASMVHPDEWSEVHRNIWAAHTAEERQARIDAISKALKDKPFTPEHLANLRASPANQKGRPVRFVPPRKLTDEQWTAIAEEFYLGTPSTVLAEKYGVSDGIILKVMRKFEVSRIAGYGTGKESLSEKHGNADKVISAEQKLAHAEKMRQLWASGAFANRKARPKKDKPPKVAVDWSAVRKQMWANMSEETKAVRAAKIAAAKVGTKMSDEARAKMRAAKLGKKHKIDTLQP